MGRLEDLIKRARLAKVHALLLAWSSNDMSTRHVVPRVCRSLPRPQDYFYQRMPTFFGHAKEQERMIQDLQNIYKEVGLKHSTSHVGQIHAIRPIGLPSLRPFAVQISVQKGIPLGDFPDPRMMQARRWDWENRGPSTVTNDDLCSRRLARRVGLARSKSSRRWTSRASSRWILRSWRWEREEGRDEGDGGRGR